METLPVELVHEIATNIDSGTNLKNFRLVCRTFSQVALPMQARRLAVIDSPESLQRFILFLKSHANFSQHTTHLVVIYPSWLVCTRDMWSVRRVLYTEADDGDSVLTGHNFELHRRFLLAEAKRNPSQDADTMTQVLHLLPHIDKLTLAPIRKRRLDKYSELCAKPFDQNSIGRVCSRILPNLRQFPRIEALDIQGRIDPCELCWDTLMHIKRLRIQSLTVSPTSRHSVTRCLRSFPSLEELRLHAVAKGHNPTVSLDDTNWIHLRSLELDNIWTTESSLKALVLRNPLLRQISARNVTLTG